MCQARSDLDAGGSVAFDRSGTRALIFTRQTMALRLACNRFIKQVSSPAAVSSVKSTVLRSFALAATETSAPDGSAPSVFDKIISLTIVDPSGARRKINGMVGK